MPSNQQDVSSRKSLRKYLRSIAFFLKSGMMELSARSERKTSTTEDTEDTEEYRKRTNSDTNFNLTPG
jgi:hypothetical protein